MQKKIVVYDLEGNFKRSFKQNDKGKSLFYWEIFNYDKENYMPKTEHTHPLRTA